MVSISPFFVDAVDPAVAALTDGSWERMEFVVLDRRFHECTEENLTSCW